MKTETKKRRANAARKLKAFLRNTRRRKAHARAKQAEIDFGVETKQKRKAEGSLMSRVFGKKIS